MDASVADLLDLLEVRSQAEGVFVGAPANDPLPRVFGGQLLGQALAAAAFTVPQELNCHSLHAYFLRPGKPGRPIEYEVASMRDGQRFAARKVMAVQRDELVFELTASFEGDEPGPEHHEPLPNVPEPESFPPEEERIARVLAHLPPERQGYFKRPRPIEFIAVDHERFVRVPPTSAPIHSWMRVRDRLPDAPNLHRAALAYASDMGALEPALRAVGLSTLDEQLQIASLDHALWFHRPFRFDEWLLFSFSPVAVGAGRGLCRGVIHTRDGRHVASLTQEAMLRPRKPNAD